MKLVFLLLLVGLFLNSHFAVSDTETVSSSSLTELNNLKSKKLDSFMTSMFNRGIFNGNVLIEDNGLVLLHKAYGYTNFNQKTDLDRRSVFNIGSISKEFTATAILILAERKYLSLDDRLNQHFPNLPSWAESISIRHLLSHSSGLPNKPYVAGSSQSMVIPQLNTIRALEFEPGSKTLYGSHGYQILASIVENVSEKPFGEFIKSEIFEPLQMQSSFVIGYSPKEPQIKATGYEFGVESIPDDTTLGGGNIYSNVEDLAKWARSLQHNRLLSLETYNAAMQPFKCWGEDCRLSTDFGIGVYKNDKLWGIHHHGGFGGYQSMLYRFPDQNRTIIFTANNGLELQYNDVRLNLIKILDDEKVTIPKKDAHILYYGTLLNQGFEAGKKHFLELVAQPELYDINERDLNSIGYFLQGQNKPNLAQQTLHLATQVFPTSINIWDSYAELSVNNRDTTTALTAYKTALKLSLNLESEEKSKQYKQKIKALEDTL